MREIRESILAGKFMEYYRRKREELIRTDEENPSPPEKKQKPSREERYQKLGDYEVHTSEKGFSSIRQISSGEIMHSVNPPEEEARRLYVEPSPPEKVKKLVIISFENDLDSLRLALKHPTKFSHLQHAAPNALLKTGEWKSADGNVTWRLLSGSFFETMKEAPAPDLVYYDLFSSRSDAKPWTSEVFRNMRRCCGERPMTLMNYSVSTMFRAILLSEGFFVASGVGTGPKSDTTIAFTKKEDALIHGALLGKSWLDRWARSGAKYPAEILEVEKANFESKILQHPQFTGLN